MSRSLSKKKDINAFVFSLDTNKNLILFTMNLLLDIIQNLVLYFFECQIRIYDEFFTKGGTTCHKGLNYRTKVDYELNNGEQKYIILYFYI